MLIDSVELTLQAGRGGDGTVSWRREKFVPMGGPDGGDGGRGGDVLAIADNNLDTLASFRYRKAFQAEAGHAGGSKKKTGRSGQDLELLVPVGTLITDIDTGRSIVDFTTIGQHFRLCRGGRGGLGNPHFVSATHQRPTESTPGELGQSKKVRLELQLVADVALIGEPNAGKSSLLSVLTGAPARIGAYAFSTTDPLLGVLKRDDATITLVDLPGLLAGAHQGRGLGDQFLKHLRRVKGLLHIVDGTQDVNQSVAAVKQELKLFDPRFAALPCQLVINKVDLLNADEQQHLITAFPGALLVSAANKTGLEQLAETTVSLGR